MKLSRSLSAAAGLALALLGPNGLAMAQESGESGEALQRESERPTQHFSVSRPAELDDAQAQRLYRAYLKDMTMGYGMAEDGWAKSYSRWRRYNKTPYRSATHGERFVNNYANGIAKRYGRFEQAGALPVGSVLAKDSFAVTDQQEVFIGPLFLMEKMPAGFNPASRDWRYSMIMPDGSLFGRTNGLDSARVVFCITCHRAAGDENDHLFFIPNVHRIIEVAD